MNLDKNINCVQLMIIDLAILIDFELDMNLAIKFSYKMVFKGEQCGKRKRKTKSN